MLLPFAQAVDGQKGEKGDCRMDDNLVGATPDIWANVTGACKTNITDTQKPHQVSSLYYFFDW